MKNKLFSAALFLLPVFAHAHPGHDGHELTWDFASGALHPLTSWQHLLPALAVGFLAVKIGGRGRWFVPIFYWAALTLAQVIAGSLFHFASASLLHLTQFSLGHAAAELALQYSAIIILKSWTEAPFLRVGQGVPALPEFPATSAFLYPFSGYVPNRVSSRAQIIRLRKYRVWQVRASRLYLVRLSSSVTTRGKGGARGGPCPTVRQISCRWA